MSLLLRYQNISTKKFHLQIVIDFGGVGKSFENFVLGGVVIPGRGVPANLQRNFTDSPTAAR